ncbi:MAG: hypothetical protein COA58_10300 [Bacteroidetes bacterium]|nr:MAG: hypothetical protein COA58_10300 [Bacteroidota bacterium]
MLKITLLFTFFLTPFVSLGQMTYVVLDGENNPNEPSVVIGPSGSISSLVAASNINNLYYYDKAKWFKIMSTSPLGVYGDPVLHYSDSVLFFAHLSKTPDKEYGDWFDRIVVQKIHSISPWDETSYSIGYNNGKMQDKPWLSSDNHSQKFNGNVYVTWTEFDQYDSNDPEHKSRIRFSKYTPQKDSFSNAITISDSTGNCTDGDSTLEGATTAIGSYGEVYAVWAGHDKIWFDKSLDGGISWGVDQVIANQINGWDMDMPNINRANGMPFIQHDKEKGIIYVCWADEQNGNADIWLIHSRDQGKTWSDRIRVNQDTTKSHQYFPNMVIDELTGIVYIAYYDFRSSPSNSFYNVYVNSYTLNGEIFEYKITKQPIALPGKDIFYGDYLDLDVQKATLAVVYTSYNLNNQSSIEMAYSKPFTKYMNQSNNTHKNTLGIQYNNQKAKLICNTVHPYELTAKIIVTDPKAKAKQVFKFTDTYTDSEVNIDRVLGDITLSETEYISKICYKMKNMATGKSKTRKYKLSY